jgi:alkanesulfonate monooxygenase SsuD/methylene tetrahydromethanopterin reductase-like flavin-dependent oxidoreductase (luciferase family)
MRLGYFTMPVHPLHRNWQETLREDREAIILADRLGFYDAFMGEHLTDQAENVTNSMMFLATLIPETSRIKLATGTSNLSQMHPVLIAAQAAMFDHLADGRFIFGISPGALTSDAEALGILDADRNKMFAEAIDIILAIWAGEPPYDIDLPDNRHKVSTGKTSALHLGVGRMHKPLQQPRPEIVGTVLAPYSKGVVLMGQRDFHPLSANFLLSSWLKSHWQNYVEGSPYRFYYSQMHAKLTRSKRLFVFKADKDQPDEAITHDFVLDQLVIHGSVNKVVDQILALHQEIGDFGEIVYAGMDWVEPALAKRSMQLMAEEVMPKVNAAIGKSAAAA